MLVSFRPHKLRIITKGEGYYDKKRDWIEGKREYSDYYPCRYEPNGAARTIALPDGQEYRYSYMIYLNIDGPMLQFGDTIELVSQDGTVIGGDFEVKGFHRGQLDAKVWV